MIRTNNLKQLRKKKRLTQKELAKKIGKSVQAVKDLEVGRHSPEKDTADNLSEVLDFNHIKTTYRKKA